MEDGNGDITQKLVNGCINLLQINLEKDIC